MYKRILVLFSLVVAAYGSGKFTILEKPDAIAFKQSDKMDGQYIGDVLRACTGRSISKSVPLKMHITSPFDLAENVCLISIEGVKEFTPQNLKPKSEIDLLGPENSKEAFTNKLYEEDASLVHIQLNDGLAALSALQDWCETPFRPENTKTLKYLKGDKEESKELVEAITVLSVMSEANCKMPTYLQIDLSLANIKSHDKNFGLLVASVEAFAERFRKNTNGNGLLAVLSSDQQSHKRSRRALNEGDDLNLAESYSEDYPVIFNIILWFGVLIVFTMIAISYAIGTMDPGRDSIIYRMTSTRIKKDN